jgi:hypothetical protein
MMKRRWMIGTIIDLNHESPHKLKAKALLGLNPGVSKSLE